MLCDQRILSWFWFRFGSAQHLSESMLCEFVESVLLRSKAMTIGVMSWTNHVKLLPVIVMQTSKRQSHRHWVYWTQTQYRWWCALFVMGRTIAWWCIVEQPCRWSACSNRQPSEVRPANTCHQVIDYWWNDVLIRPTSCVFWPNYNHINCYQHWRQKMLSVRQLPSLFGFIDKLKTRQIWWRYSFFSASVCVVN